MNNEMFLMFTFELFLLKISILRLSSQGRHANLELNLCLVVLSSVDIFV